MAVLCEAGAKAPKGNVWTGCYTGTATGNTCGKCVAKAMVSDALLLQVDLHMHKP